MVPPARPIKPPVAGPTSRAAQVRRAVWIVVGLALAGVAVWTVAGKRGELSGSGAYLDHIEWAWIVLAAAAEGASYLSLAGLQSRLLRAGSVAAPIPGMTAVTAAGNSIQNTFPAGLVLTTAYLFRQYRRYGADDVVAAWVVVTVGVMSFATLTVIAAAGVILALSSASAFDLVVVVVGMVVVAALLVVAWVKRPAWMVRTSGLLRFSQRVIRRPHGDPDAMVRGWLEELGAINPSRTQWAAAATLAIGNWLADLGCLALAFLAVHADVPWRGLLLAYGAGQLAAVLPITPGGLGVVEGSLTIALVAFGGAEASSVAAVLVYRLLSFWLMLPLGWGAWAGINLSGRRRTRRAIDPRAGPAGALVGAGEDA